MDEQVEKQLGEFTLIQRSSDGYINADYLEKQLDNDYLAEVNASVRDIVEGPTTERLIKDLENTAMDDGVFYEEDESEVMWISPALLLPFAMQISPKLEMEVIKWFYDSRMIENL